MDFIEKSKGIWVGIGVGFTNWFSCVILRTNYIASYRLKQTLTNFVAMEIQILVTVLFLIFIVMFVGVFEIYYIQVKV